MVFTRKKSRGDADPESPPKTQPEINIHEVCTLSRTVFMQEHYELFLQKVFQDSQYLEVEVLQYRVLCVN